MKLFRPIRFLYQRLTRGFSDKDTWDLHYEIAKFTLPRIKRLKALTLDENCVAGHPAVITYEEWLDILDKIIYSMDWTVKEYDSKIENDSDVDDERWQEGFDLLGKWFQHLGW